MKKSKIIIPALGVLVLSTAASITGTVAWFTANRTATITTGDFAVVKTDGNLDAEVTAGAGTTKASAKVINPISSSAIGDASFNPESKILWNDTGDGSAYRTIPTSTPVNAHTNLTDADHPWKISNTAYHAVNWKITFTYTWGADHTTLNVFFDAKDIMASVGSKMVGTNQDETAYTAQTAKGFRIAMIGATGTYKNTVVFAGLQNAADLACVTSSSTTKGYADSTATALTGFTWFAADKYGAAGEAGTAYSNVGQENGGLARAVDGDASQRTRKDFLGQLVYADAATSTLDVICVAWYEGTSPNVVDKINEDVQKLQQVASTLKFYAALDA